jgi:hypothetical protein
MLFIYYTLSHVDGAGLRLRDQFDVQHGHVIEPAGAGPHKKDGKRGDHVDAMVFRVLAGWYLSADFHAASRLQDLPAGD